MREREREERKKQKSERDMPVNRLQRKVDYTIKIKPNLSTCLPEHGIHYLPIREWAQLVYYINARTVGVCVSVRLSVLPREISETERRIAALLSPV